MWRAWRHTHLGVETSLDRRGDTECVLFLRAVDRVAPKGWSLTLRQAVALLWPLLAADEAELVFAYATVHVSALTREH